MKKLMIAMAVAMLGVVANAAAVTWAMSAITDSPDNTKSAGWVGYYLDAGTYTAFEALAADQVAAYVSENALYSATTASNRGAIQLQVKSPATAFEAGDTMNGYLVLFDAASASDAKNFAYTGLKDGVIGAAGANLTLNYGTFAASTKGGWQTTAVPEPTSGLLMLLGMAGLALRRRRA